MTQHVWTERELNRSTLARQGLLQLSTSGVVDMIRRIGGLQAQEPSAPYVALWNRIADFEPSALDQAYADRAVIKATLMRITLHAVAAEDHHTFHTAMRPVLRASRVNDRRYRDTGLVPDDADLLIEPLWSWASQPRTKHEILDWIDEQRGGETDPRMWWALRTYAPLAHSPNDAVWSFDSRQVFEAAPSALRRIDRAGALRELVLRYLSAFGPASVADVAQFTLLPRSLVRDVLTRCRDGVTVATGPDGNDLYDTHDPAPIDGDTPAPPRLLGMWDQILLAYADRTRIITDAYRPLVCRRNGDILPTVLIDGHIAGVWRPVPNGIEVTPFATWSTTASEELETEAERLYRFLTERNPDTFARAHNWWNKLPNTDRTLLGDTGR